MSNIGKKPITVEESVKVEVSGDIIKISGSKGAFETRIPAGILVNYENGVIQVAVGDNSHGQEKIFGLTRALLYNMVKGVTSGFEKKLELVGVGFRGKVEGEDLVLNVGYSIPIKIHPPQGIKMSVVENIITVSGIDKQVVGDIASKIRAVRPPDSYKGKGIRYLGERVRKKAGKAAKTQGVK